ncbi:putative GTPase [Flavobacterium piscis]|uniref:GTPase n=1 Tax=Flavobacterium piscis TaxID=1114874 RepID=A0ABU1Y917_9FLAO|nr:putative GTPase [Flavobacterium piscis]
MKKYADNEKKMENNLKEKVEVVYIQNTPVAHFRLVNPVESAIQLFASFDAKPISVSNSTFHPPSYFI